MNAKRDNESVSDEQKAAAEKEIVEQSKRIEFYLTEYTVELLASKTRDGELHVPGYQREFTWEDERKSRFIESLVMGLPIPFLFFWEMQDGRLEIVDGSQRLRTIEEFVLGDFRLGPLQSLPTLSNFRFADLLASRQRKIKNRSIRGIVLNEHADEQARFDMFERLNTGSKITNPAEVRRGALGGPFMELVIELAKLPTLVRLAAGSKKRIDEREHEELVLRFFAYRDGLDDYNDRPAEFLFNYAKSMNEKITADPALGDHYRQRFLDMINFVEVAFPYGFRRTADGKATPRARFESISIGSSLALEENPHLARQPPNVGQWLHDAEFKKIVSAGGSNAKSRILTRTQFVRDRLLGR